MDDRHLTLPLLRAVHRGERSSGDLAAKALSHLFELCSHCREVFEDWRRERLDLGEPRPEAGVNVVSRLGKRGDRQGFRSDERSSCVQNQCGCEDEGEDHVETPLQRMREILALPDAERVETVRQKPSRYSGAELSRLLLEQARGQLPAEPGQAYALAGLARAVLQHGNATSEATELYALALAHQGNALRAQGELVPAEEFLESARFLLDAQGPGNPRPRAELDSLEGSLRWAQRRFDEAKALLTRAVAFQMAEEQPVEAARALLKLGLVYWEEGALPHAIDCATRAASVFSEHGETKLLLMALHNLAFCLLEAGEGERSRATFAESLPLYEQFDDLRTQLRRVWLEGHLSKAEGNVEAAEDAFRAVRDGFLEQGVGYDAAIAALDLAFLYAERGRTAELKRVAEEIVPVFEAQDVHREAAAALMLFQEAVRQERATVQFLGDLTRYLEQARRDPSLRFRQGETAGRGSAG